jgi:hypothetical protein
MTCQKRPQPLQKSRISFSFATPDISLESTLAILAGSTHRRRSPPVSAATIAAIAITGANAAGRGTTQSAKDLEGNLDDT